MHDPDISPAVAPLMPRKVHKVWGRRDIPELFGPADDEPVGEIWFEHPDGRDAELLVKFLFTSERLSIQVHPDDDAARNAGYPRGKDEAWLILSVESGAKLGLGTRRPLSKAELTRAVVDGQIVDLVDWRDVRENDLIFSPAGTIHAIGAGLTLIEIQQSCDLTYRLYDYGRPRELHLEEGIAAADPNPYAAAQAPFDKGAGRTILASGGAFVVERCTDFAKVQIVPEANRPVWLIPLSPGVTLDGRAAEFGSVWIAEAAANLSVPDGSVLIAYTGSTVAEHLLSQR